MEKGVRLLKITSYSYFSSKSVLRFEVCDI